MSYSTKIAVVHEYDKRGWRMTPTRRRGKEPYRDGWQNERLDLHHLAEIFAENPEQNIGVLLGEPSEWLIDVDLDHAKAVEIADRFLPPTNCVFGRAGKLRSHRLYHVTEPVETRQHRLPKLNGEKSGKMIVELRSTGTQTVFPGSVHPSNEPIEFDEAGEPASIAPSELLQAVANLADAVRAELGVATPVAVATYSHAVPDRAKLVERARGYIADDAAIEGSNGSGTAYHVACVLFRCGLTDDEARGLFGEFNSRCVPPWNEKEIAHKLADAREAVTAAGDFGKYVHATTRNGDNKYKDTGGKLPPLEKADTRDEADDEPPPRRLIRVRMSDVTPRPIHWIWQDRIAAGKVTLFAGDPGLGKSTITTGIAATVSRGWMWADQSPACEPGNVIILSAEDGIEDTICPRLMKADADLDRIECIQGVGYGDDKPDRRVFNLKFDVPLLVEAINSWQGVKLVIIDPVSSFLDGCDTNKNGDVRSALQPLVDAAEQHGIAILMVTHLSKAAARSALSASTGSLAFGALARQAHLVVADPDDSTGEQRLFLCMKSNICRKPSGMRYTINNGMLLWDADEVSIDADTALSRANRPEKHNKRDEAKAWLLTLGLDREPMLASRVEELAGQVGHSFHTVRRAFKAVNGITFRDGFRTPYKWKIEGAK